MAKQTNNWTLLTYKIPAQPTRLRLKIWRKLQSMGAVYLQDAVYLLPSRPDLDENMAYVANSIQEMGGTCHLFSAAALLPGSDEAIATEFRVQADSRLGEIAGRLEKIQNSLEQATVPTDLERIEEELKRERVAYLRARRLAYFGSTQEATVDDRLDALKRALDDLYRSSK
jgi:hypothetical protein